MKEHLEHIPGSAAPHTSSRSPREGGSHAYKSQLDYVRRSGHDHRQKEPSPCQSSACPNAGEPGQDWRARLSQWKAIAQAEQCRSHSGGSWDRPSSPWRQGQHLISGSHERGSSPKPIQKSSRSVLALPICWRMPSCSNMCPI